MFKILSALLIVAMAFSASFAFATSSENESPEMPFTVWIQGPSEVPNSGPSGNVWCTWDALVFGGTTPYEYAWHQITISPYNEMSFSEMMPTEAVHTGPTDQWVQVTDANDDYVIEYTEFDLDPGHTLDTTYCWIE